MSSNLPEGFWVPASGSDWTVTGEARNAPLMMFKAELACTSHAIQKSTQVILRREEALVL